MQSVHQMFRRNLSSRASSGWDFGDSLLSPGAGRKILRPEMNLEEQREWERQEMEKMVNFTEIHIDPAPFQLVEKLSLLKVLICSCFNISILFRTKYIFYTGYYFP